LGGCFSFLFFFFSQTEQCGGDLAAAQEQLADVEANLKLQHDEMEALQREQEQAKVRLFFFLLFKISNLLSFL
jgi:hypothetical protein